MRKLFYISVMSVLLALVGCSELEDLVSPKAPTNLEVSVASGNVTLTWQDESDDEVGFEVYRKETEGDSSADDLEGFDLLETTEADVVTYTDSDVATGSYFYAVAAVGELGELSRSAPLISQAVSVSGTPEAPDEGEDSPEQPDDAKVLEGNFEVNTQAEMDALASVTEINGILIIQFIETESFDFSPLDKLRKVDILSIDANPALVEVSGFEALESAAISISDNESLVSLPDFNALQEAKYVLESPEFPAPRPIGIRIDSNPSLKLLPAFEGLKSAFRFGITNNASLTSITYTGTLENLNDDVNESFDLFIADNASLAEIKGFDTITNLGSISIIDNPELSAISGLNNVATLVSAEITKNPKLSSISGFAKLGDGAGITITGNDVFDCAAEPQASLPFLPVAFSTNNSVDCPTIP